MNGKASHTYSSLIKNSSMLYLLSIAKMVLPLITFPYLTRILSVDGYATVVYVKSFMLYFQIFVDFGFMLSATKAIVEARGDHKAIDNIVSNTILARIILSTLTFLFLIPLSLSIPLLRDNASFVFLSFIVIALSSFLVDFLFRGLEQMQEIAIRFILMKGLSTALTFILVHSDEDLYLIPVLDIISSVIAVFLILKQMKKYSVRIVTPHLKTALLNLKQSFTFFLSSVATTAFGALNTVLIGIMLPSFQVAIWSIALQIIGTIQVFFSPIIDGIYPQMIKTKSLKLIKKVILFFVPVVISGCVLLYFLSDLAIYIIAGNKYSASVPILRMLLPVLLFSFPAMLFGWPALGAIGRINETSMTTIASAFVQIVGLCLLIATSRFTVSNIAILRGVTELSLLIFRARKCYKYRDDFST